MKIEEIYGSRSLTAADLDGKSVRLRISDWEVVQLNGEDKIVLHFNGAKKGLVLNKTNAKQITTNLRSSEIDAWRDKTITVFPTTCLWKGEEVDCIRVEKDKSGSKKSTVQTAQVEDDDSPPF